MNTLKRIKKYLIVISILLMVFVVENYASLLKPVLSVKGKILEANTEQGISAKITLYNLEGEIKFRTKASSSKNGKYYMTGLMPNEEYIMKITPNTGYLEVAIKIRTPKTNQFDEIDKDIEIKKIDNLTKVEIKSKIFANLMDVFKEGVELRLKNKLQIIKNSNDIVIINYKDESKSRELLTNRLNSIKNYLIYKGIDEAKFRIIHSLPSSELTINN